ncbi:hypothetical protein EDD57_1697 [Baia soyae]|uniref:Uncharacterized protein n=1 Tax=Baia soyae TaxID=1544746 RepID=A0A4R2RFC0_9BACL|nr:hypothetical protein EDD57_1697 [Baia soyae]
MGMAADFITKFQIAPSIILLFLHNQSIIRMQNPTFSFSQKISPLDNMGTERVSFLLYHHC